ncbi:anti-sigma factor [Brevibacillus agri]|uniref:anti-sigma factor n=1 Tax=Brevibacillus agri TaxID=51101 RepID=UPI0002A4E54A|nr:anti-sigma factor [Brevibacillus agri]ELK44032.1 anti-sigma-M factor [Brevibacillus agri BAB-2500]MBG9568006.1 anti-sigma M factor [Brevibacillus agri]MDR9506313.1 anti-sigma factor [Brevibacillus agri]WHX29870.1 anti-sigma factor [Brevibacillus agri]
MTNQNGDDREQKLLAYLRGDLTGEEAKRLGEELADDEEYGKRLERLLLGEEQGTDGKQEAAPGLSEARQRAIVRRGKWKNRLTTSFYAFAIPCLAGVLLLFVNGWVGRLMHDDLFRVARDMVNFTQPGVSVGSSGSQVGLLYGSIDMELREQVGNEAKSAGRFRSTNVLWNVSARPEWTGGVREQKLFFRYPLSAGEPEEDTSFLRTPAWTTLEKLPEGTVSQLAISFDSFLTYEQYVELVSRHVSSYNQETVWFAVDTGVEVKQVDGEAGNLLLGPGEVWGFAERELDYGTAPIQVNGEGERRMAAFMGEMKYLTEQKSLARDMGYALLSGGNPQLEERYRYLQEKGVRIYGAVLTGPTKELLRLKEEKSITAAFVGKIDWWNWERPAASGTQNSW